MHEAENSDTDAPGTLIGDRYVIEGLLGKGGMASVYRAHDETLERTVALKIFRSDIADSEHLRRTTSEVRLLASLNHPSLVTLFDASIDPDAASGGATASGAPSAGPFLVMELIEGPTLRDRIGQGPLPAAEVAAMAADLGEALHVVHGRGVVHRDIKPSNVLLSPSPTAHREFRAKLADFGIAYLIDATQQTAPGTLIGTAAYVSPEQAQGDTPTAATDIYSLGLVLIEALTAKRSFPGPIMESVTARLVKNPDVPDALGPDWRSLLQSMTARDPEQRPTAIEVADAARELERKVAASELATQLNEVVPGSGEGHTAPLTTPLTTPPTAAGEQTFTEAFLMPAGSAADPDAALDEAGMTRVLPVLDPDAVVPPAGRLHLAEDATGATERIGPIAPTSGRGTAVGALAGDPTSGMNRSGALTDATELLSAHPQAVPGARGATGLQTAVAPAASAPTANRGAALRWLIVVVIALVIVAGALIAVWLSGALNGAGTPQPTLPPIEGPLGDHLRQLLDEVTP